MHDPLILSYLAGVIDSDGCIRVKKSTYAMRVRKDATQAVYAEQIMCKQVEPHAVELLHATFGGYRSVCDPTAKRGRPLHSWNIHSRSAGEALKALVPYLRIKRAQAENALALRALIGQGRRWEVPPIVDGEPMVTATEFAALAGAKQITILQACRLKSIPSVRVGRSRLVPLSFLAAYKARMACGGRAPRAATVTEKMERCAIRSKELNRVGIRV